MSIRRRLLIILLCTLTGVWLFSVTANYYDSRHEVKELLDADLAQYAEVLLALSDHELVEERLNTGPTTIAIDNPAFAAKLNDAHKYTKKLAFQVWLNDSTLALRSSSAPSILLSNVTEGFSDQIIANQPWRIYSLHHNDLPIMVQVGERYDVRGNLSGQVAMRILTPVLITLPILSLLIWYGIGFAMRPLYRVANEVGERKADHLEPVDDRMVPAEAKPLVQSLNALLIRVKKTLDNERHFTADAAHELRTPLAAIKAQTQVALKTLKPDDQQIALQKVIHGVDNATRVIQQLLTLARIDPATPLEGLKKVDLCHYAAEVIAELVPLALKKDIDISLSEPCEGVVNGNGDALSILLANLTHNAINYTPEQGTITVEITTTPNGVILRVCDSGPGIPEEERETVLRRFHRGRGVTQSGSGLGLSIVSRIAELHNAQVVLGDCELGGLQVEVIFPRAV